MFAGGSGRSSSSGVSSTGAAWDAPALVLPPGSSLAPQRLADASAAFYDPAESLGEVCDAAAAAMPAADGHSSRGGGSSSISDAVLSQWDVVLLTPDGGGGAGSGPLSLPSGAAAGAVGESLLAGLAVAPRWPGTLSRGGTSHAQRQWTCGGGGPPAPPRARAGSE